MERYRTKYDSTVRELPPELLTAFTRYHWPGNVRQLENSVKRFLILPNLRQALAELDERAVSLAMPVPALSGNTSLKTLAANAAEKAEKELVFRTLNEVNWNRKQAAQRLNICYKSLLNKLHRWQYERDSQLAEESGHASEPLTAASSM